MVVVGWPQSVQTTSVIGVLHRRPLDFSARLIDDGDEIRERFVAHGRVWPMWSKSQESAIEPAVDRPVDDAPTRDGLRRRAGHGAVPEFIKILEAGSRGGELVFADQGVGVGDGCPNVGKIADRRGKSRAGHEPAGETLKSSVSRVIDLRTDIVMLLADVTRTGGWNASRDGGIGSGTGIARLRRAAWWVALQALPLVAESALIANGNA
jgi:hypothetical protein